MIQVKQFQNSHGVGLSWDNLSTETDHVDVDLQAVIVSEKGVLLDAVYFNKLSAYRNAILHAGDSLDGDKEGFDEMIWVQPHRLPANVQLIIFVVAIYHGGTLMDVDNGVISVFDVHGVVARIPLERSHGSVDVVALMKNCGDGIWNFHKVDELAESGQHFLDILEPTIGNVIRRHIPTAPKCKMSFNTMMQKGHVVDIPLGWLETTCFVGIGWQVMPNVRMGKGLDLDVAGVFFDEKHNELGAVCGEQVQLFGATHSGDNQTGSGSGDDETITVDLGQIPDHVAQIFFVVNVSTPGYSLSYIQSGYCRFVGEGGELGRYDFVYGEKKPGKIFARLIRSTWRGGGRTKRWCFQMVGRYCFGRNWHSSVEVMKELCQTCPLELQGRQPLPVDESTGLRSRQLSESGPAKRSRFGSGFDTNGSPTHSRVLGRSRGRLSTSQSLQKEPFIKPSHEDHYQGRARFLMSL